MPVGIWYSTKASECSDEVGMYRQSFMIFTSRLVVAGLFVLLWTAVVPGQYAQLNRSQTSQAGQTEKILQWPESKQIHKELEQVAKYQITASWAEQTRNLVTYICEQTTIDDPQAIAGLKQLQEATTQIDSIVSELREGEYQSSPEAMELVSQLQRMKYRLERRVLMWSAAHRCAIQRPSGDKQDSPFRTASRRVISFDGVLDPRWRDYLKVDDLEDSFRALQPDEKRQRDAARKFLARFHSASLSSQQRSFLESIELDQGVMQVIRDAASEPVDYNKLLTMMEKMQGRNSTTYAYRLNEQYQNLLWSGDSQDREMAGMIDSHYRNANARVAANKKLLNALLPQMPNTVEPLSDVVAGAQVTGHNHISNQLRIALIPNPNEIDLQLVTTGQVETQSVARKSGFQIHNRGMADFHVFKRLAFNRTGVRSESPTVFANASQRLVGLRGKLDRVPLVGGIARRIARQKVEEETPAAETLVRQKVEADARQRVESEVAQQVQQFRQSIQRFVLDPLTSIDLEPETMETATTENRIMGRFRIAGRDQLAAHQPRPTDFESDLLTIQLHQSAFNNLFGRIGLNGRKFTPKTLAEHLRKVTGITNQSKHAEGDAELTFATHDPIRIDFRDGLISLQFKFSRLKVGNSTRWKNLIVRVNFEPEYIGTRMILHQQTPVDIRHESLRLKDEIIIRGMFKVLLEDQYAFDVMPKSLMKPFGDLAFAIDRLTLADGWCGIALGNPATSGHEVPIVAPADVNPGAWSDQMGSLQWNRPEDRAGEVVR